MTQSTQDFTKVDVITAGSHPSFSYHLPYELEREICEIVAYNLPKCIPNLILIARRFRIWFEPEIYRIIRSGPGRVIPPLYNSPLVDSDRISDFLDKPRIQAFGHHVQHVLLQRRSVLEIAEILNCCPNVSDLALWFVRGTYSDLIPVMEKLPLRKLSIDPSCFFPHYSIDGGIPFGQPMFFNITHLEIINSSSSWSKWKQLALLPKLTHLAQSGSSVEQEFLNRVLEECRALKVLILFYYNMEFLPDDLKTTEQDDRVVLFRDVPTPLDEWEKDARGEENFWMVAQRKKEEAILARKDGQVATTGLALA